MRTPCRRFPATEHRPRRRADGLVRRQRNDCRPRTRVDFDPAAEPRLPIDGKRFFRFRWRFHVPATYPGWTEGSTTGLPMPQVQSLAIEFER